MGKALRVVLFLAALLLVVAMLANGADFDSSTKTLGIF